MVGGEARGRSAPKVVIAAKGEPAEPGTSSGAYIRLGQYIAAAARLTRDPIRLVHFAGREAMAALPDPATASRQQSEHWGVEVELRVVPVMERRETLWNHYGAAMFSVASQQPQFRFLGPDQRRMVGEAAAGADLFVSRYLVPAEALRRSGARPGRVVLDLDDPDHLARWRRVAALPMRPGKLLHALQLPALVAAERRLLRFADMTIVCSEKERDNLRRLGIGRAEVLHNAAPLPENPPRLPAEPTMLFLGLLSYPPNAAAAQRMIARILPRVRRAVPGARLVVAGHGPEAVPAHADRPEGVEFTGFVSDLDALYARSRVVVCPLLHGTGTRVKLAEAGGRARPMVSTRIGAEGLRFRDGHDILLRDDDEGFAEACARLLRDDAECERLRANARATAMAHHDASASVDRLEGLLRGLPGR